MATKPPTFTLPATVNVEQRHIDAGRAGKCRECPIALAIQQTLGTPQIWASPDGVRHIADWPYGRIVQIGKLPAEAITFMGRFDRLEPVAPFSFVLEAA